MPGSVSSPRAHPSRLFGGLVGAVLAYLLTSTLPLVASTVLSSLGLAVGAGFSGRRRHPLVWWAGLGAVAGGLVGTAAALAGRLQELDPRGDWSTRSLVVVLLSGDANRSDRHQPRDVLRSVSALTTGIFAVLVTLAFVHSGLDVARTFSSRLSVSLTILVASITVPGWVMHLLFRQSRVMRGPANAES